MAKEEGTGNGNYHRCSGIYTKMQSAPRINIQNVAGREKGRQMGDKPGEQGDNRRQQLLMCYHKRIFAQFDKFITFERLIVPH